MWWLLLAGCFQRYAPIRNAAQLERQDDPTGEAAWEKVLHEELTVGEWRLSHRRFCRLRAERVTQALATLDTSASYEEISRLRREMVDCPREGQIIAELVGLEEATARERLEPLLEHAEVDPYGALTDAREHLRHLQRDSPTREPFNAHRDALIADVQSKEAMEGPVTQARLRGVRFRMGHAEEPDDAAVRAALSVPIGRVTVEGCQRDWRTPAGRGDTHLTITVSDCATQKSKGTVKVWKNITTYRQEWQKVPVTTTIRTITPVITTNVNCYNSLKYGGTVCTEVGTYTRYEKDETTTTHYESRLVEVPETKRVQVEELRYRHAGQLTASITAEGPDGSFTWTDRVQFAEGERVAEPTSRETFGALLEALRETAEAQAIRHALDSRLDDLETRAGHATADARNAAFTLEAAGRPLASSTLEAIAEALAIPVSGFAEDAPHLADVDPIDYGTSRTDYRIPRVEEGLVRHGFSPAMVTTGGGRSFGSDSLQAHAQPRATHLVFRGDFGSSLTTGRASNGFGVHATGFAGLQWGMRTQKAYTFTELPLGQNENDKEPKSYQAFEAGAGVMAGVRTAPIALFIGVRPQAMFFFNGFYRTLATGVPLAARLELRPVQRRPLVLDVWGFDQAGPTEDTWGARLAMPIGERVWMTAFHGRQSGRTQVRGLHDRDVLDAGRQPIRQTWAGLTYGF